MREPAHQKHTLKSFYDWVVGQEARYEWVDGEPVMLAGANRRHDRIVINAMVALTQQ